jgi:lipopolysaccharide export system protein LptC
VSDRTQRLLAVLLLLVGGLAFWLQREVADDRPPSSDEARRPDYWVEGLSATTMDAQGQPERRLVATELRHYARKDASELDDPVLTLFNPEAPPWVARSERGLISDGGDRIDLIGDVHLRRAGSASLRPLHLTTEALWVEPEQELARTDRPMRLTSNEDWVTSAGGALVHYGDSLRVELFGPARARIEVSETESANPAETAEETP